MISARRVSKIYPGKRALDDVSVSFDDGKVTALIGGNGAGKSTLLRIMGGAIPPTSGEVILGARGGSFHSVGRARAAGVWMADQEGSLIPAWTVEEHFGRLAGVSSGTPWHSLLPAIEGSAIVGALPQFERQLIEIALVCAGGNTAALFDEPTGGQGAREKRLILEALRSSASAGAAVIWVTHDLDAALAVADRIVALQNGKVVADLDPAQSTRDDLMAAFLQYERAPEPIPTSTPDEGWRMKIRLEPDGDPICISAGEIAGIASNSLSKTRQALRAAAACEHGRQFVIELPDGHQHARIAYMSRERDLDWDFPGRSLCFNLTAGLLPRLTRAGIVDRRSELREADRLRREFLIDSVSLDTAIDELSGGNRQKALLARLTSMKPEILLLDEPFSGVDVSTRLVLRGALQNLARKGMAIAIYSQEWEDLVQVVDRLFVVRDDNRLASFSASSASAALIESTLGSVASSPAI